MSKEYRFTSFWKWFHRIYGAFFAVAPLLILYDFTFKNNFIGRDDYCLIPWLIALCVFYAIHGLFHGYFERDILSPDGFQYHTLGYSFRTDWKNLQQTGNRWQGLIYKFEGVFVRYFSDDLKVWLPGVIWGKEIFVPLSMFSDPWSNSDLGQQIKQYAPHLFQ
jgi:hypothetical protein